MKKLLAVCCSVCVIAAVALTGCASGGESIGTVNGDSIAKSQYDLQYNQNKSYLEAFGISLDDENGQAMLAQIEQSSWEYAVSNVILVQAAEEVGISVSDADAQKVLDESKSTSFETDEEYKQWLTDNNMTEAQVLELFRLQEYNRQLFEHVTKDVTVTEAEAKEVYEADPDAYDNKKTSHILIKVDADATDEDWASAKQEAQDLIKQLDEGADFATLAKEHSDDGSAADGGVLDYGVTVNDSSMYAEYVAAVWDLDGVGTYSKTPVKSEAGYHIIKIDEEKIGFEAVKQDIMDQLATDEKNTVYSEYMNAKRDAAEILRAMTFTYWTEGNDTIATVAGYTDPAPTEKPTTNNDDSAANTDNNAANDGNAANSDAANQPAPDENTTPTE